MCRAAAFRADGIATANPRPHPAVTPQHLWLIRANCLLHRREDSQAGDPPLPGRVTAGIAESPDG
jgi:hypothetical protein